MKKSLVALATLSIIGMGAASAQSSVTLFGVVDVAFAHGSGNGTNSADVSQLKSDGYNSSRIGFRGTEDLGGGMSASFWLEAGINADNGTGGGNSTNNQATTTSGGGLNFNRRSTVSLASGLGELRLGRDYTPQFWNQTVFDPFGTNGAGTTQTLNSGLTLQGATAVRASNSIGYFLPGNLGGFYGQFQHYLGENLQDNTAGEKSGTGTAVRFGWANGPVNVALATSSTKQSVGTIARTIKSNNIGGSYDFGVATLQGLVSRDKVEALGTNVTGKGAMIGTLIPMGAGQIRASYSTYKGTSPAVNLTPKSKKIALGYVHNLSKRTALYTTFARVTNSGGADSALNGARTAPNSKSTGYDFGIKHSF